MTGWECWVGHEMTDRNTGWMAGDAYCLVCVEMTHRKIGTVEGRLIGMALGFLPFPSRDEVLS